MHFQQSKNGYQACFTAKEISLLLIQRMFRNLFSAKNLQNEAINSPVVSEFITGLAKQSTDSKEYEYFTAILDLYPAFEKKCQFGYRLNADFNPTKHKILSLEDLEKFKEDPPDVIVIHSAVEYPFELKRYRDKLDYDSLYKFVQSKIIRHYSVKYNFMVILQVAPYETLNLNLFKKLSKELLKDNNQPGYIIFTCNNANKEIYTIVVLPKLEVSKRPYGSESENMVDLFAGGK